MKILVTVIFMVYALNSFSQSSGSGSIIPDEIRLSLNKLVEAYNSGDTTQLKKYIQDSHHPQVLEQVPMSHLMFRITNLYYQYGTVTPKIYEAKSKTSSMVWVRGEKSKAWLGLMLIYTEKAPHKVTNIGIDRGQSPPSSELFTRASSMTAFKTQLANHVKAVSAANLFSGTVAVSQHGKIIYSAVTGYSDNKAGKRNNSQSLFVIASTSKIFTAARIMQLQELGKLKLDDVISKYISEYPKNIADSVSIHRLLTHTSGIELDEVPEFNQESSNTQSIKDLIDLQVKHIPKVPELVNYRLPSEFNYSNENYALLARIVEVVSGMDYWDYVAKNIFQRGGMYNTFPIHKAGNSVVKGYTNRNPSNGAYTTATPVERVLSAKSIAHPAGGIVSTADDLLLFMNALVSGKIISAASFAEMSKGHVEEAKGLFYGYGLRIYKTLAGKMIGHAGDILGYNCRLDYYPSTGVIVAAVTNQDQTAKNMADYINEILPLKKLR